jgi:hypothetical protein
MTGLQKVLKVVSPCLKTWADIMSHVFKVAAIAKGGNGTVFFISSEM